MYLLVLFNLGHLWSCPVKAYCITQHTTIKTNTKNGMERDWMIPWLISVTELFASNWDKHTANADSNLKNLKQLPDDKTSDKQGLTDSHQVFSRLILYIIILYSTKTSSSSNPGQKISNYPPSWVMLHSLLMQKGKWLALGYLQVISHDQSRSPRRAQEWSRTYMLHRQHSAPATDGNQVKHTEYGAGREAGLLELLLPLNRVWLHVHIRGYGMIPRNSASPTGTHLPVAAVNDWTNHKRLASNLGSFQLQHRSILDQGRDNSFWVAEIIPSSVGCGRSKQEHTDPFNFWKDTMRRIKICSNVFQLCPYHSTPS